MNRFSRIRHHVNMEDVKKKRLYNITVKRRKEEEKREIEEISKKYRSNWKKELFEGMTTGSMYTQDLPSEGDTPIDIRNPVDSASYQGATGVINPGDNLGANVGTVIRDSGTGSGTNGGFNVGGQYLAFQGTGSGSNNTRFAALSPIDSTQVDTLSITAIVGNDVNGGEDPDLSSEGLLVMYKTPAMANATFLSLKPDNSSGEGNGIIIPSPASHDGGLNNYSIKIPEYARAEGTQFILMQFFNSGNEFDNYGLTNINFQRRAPINVVVSLDDPAAISFISVGTNEGDPKKRKKKINDQLSSSDEYTTSAMGSQFPGQGARIDGEDPFKSTTLTSDEEIKASPVGSDEVKKTFSDFKKGDQRVEIIKTPEQIKAQNDEYLEDLKNLSKNDYTDARITEIADKILKTDPKNIDAYVYKIGVDFQTGDIKAVLKTTDIMIKNNPDNDLAYQIRSMMRKQDGNLAGAIEDLEKAIELNPDDMYIAYSEMELADLKFQEAEVEGDNAEKDRIESEAAAIQEKAHQDYWNNPADLTQLDISEEEQQQISSNLAQAKDLMTTTHYQRGRDGLFSKGAVELLQEILPIDPNNIEILSNLGVAMIMNRYSSSKEGIEYLEKAQALDPNVKINFGINSWDKYDDQFSASDPAYSGSKIERLADLPHRYAREVIKNLPDQSTAKGATYGPIDSDYAKEYGGSYSKYYRDRAKGESTKVLQRMLVAVAREIENNKYWMDDLGRHRIFRNNVDIIGAPGYVLGATKFTGALNGVTQEDWLREYEIWENWPTDKYGYYQGDWLSQWDKVNKISRQLTADRKIMRINASIKMSVEQYEAYYDEYMSREVGELPELSAAPTLYGWMEETYDTEEINKEIQELGFDKQYKDLMNAWDSADKFSKFITPLKNLSDALLGSKTAQNAKYENYKIAIAKSIMLNKPIRVNPDTIDPKLIKKLGDRITPNQILSYDEEQRFKKAQEAYAKLVKQGKGDPSLLYDYDQPLATDGIPLIPIVSEPVPYADENIYEDEFGRVFTNDGSVANTTLQPDRAYHGFASAYKAEILGTNPLAGRGQAQYQIVVPPDGSEPYLLYKDHAYHNVKSADEGEVPGFMNKGAAGFVNWLGNTAHKRSDGDANTDGMAGYPPNIRGDVITEFRINLTDLPEQVQNAVYRHPLMTEQPELVQALKDTIYTEKNVKKILGSKDLHNFYTGALKAADAAKDWVVDNAVETIMGQMPGAFDFTTASNLLQKYDDYIQQTVHSSDGKTYVPGYIDADENISQRVDLTDQLTSRDTKHLEKMMFGTGTSPEATIQNKYLRAVLKGYNNKTISEKSKIRNELTAQLKQQINKLSGEGDATPTKEEYSPSLSNSLGKGLKVDVDEFLKGKLVIKKSYVFRHDDKIDSPIANGLAMMFDVSNDTIAAGGRADKSLLLSLVTMNAARQLLRPVRGPGIIPGTKQSFAQAMNTAPSMPYKIEIPLPQYLIDIMNDIKQEGEDTQTNKSGLGSAGSYVGGDATAAATAAAFNKDKRNKNNKNVNESNLYERLKKRPFFNPKDIKPTFPENDPPQLDPKTGMHPNYGKQAGRYKKLDPISADSMPPTGDPETDAIVNKQKTKRTFSKIKKFMKDA